MFKITTNQAAVKDTGGSRFIGSSGVYDVVIKFASVNTSAGGAESIAFNIEYEGNTQTLYGPYYRNKDGNINEIGATLYNKLGVIAGMTDGDEPTVESETHRVGKDNVEKEFAVIQEFTDLAVKIQIQAEYSVYNDEIQERMVIRNFFRDTDGATADEIVNEKEAGKQLAVVLDKYADNVSYKDNLNEEAVQEWKAARNKGETKKVEPKTKAKATKGSMFG